MRSYLFTFLVQVDSSPKSPPYTHQNFYHRYHTVIIQIIKNKNSNIYFTKSPIIYVTFIINNFFFFSARIDIAYSTSAFTEKYANHHGAIKNPSQ